MALRGVKPTKIEKRLKAFLYGEAGSGKTTTAIQFPKPYLIDTEKGSENDEYVELIEEQGGCVFQTSDFDDMYTEIRSLLTEDHDYKTLIIDPLTIVYNELLEQCILKVGSEFGRHYGEANRKMKSLMNLLLRLDMNVIVTAHAKKEYGDNLTVLGNTFDGYKKIDYLFDLVLELQVRGKENWAKVKKTRIKSFGPSESFKCSYEEISKRYGNHILERQAQKVVLASESQLSELRTLMAYYKPGTLELWLNKVSIDSIDMLTSVMVDKWISAIKSKHSKTNQSIKEEIL